MHTAARRRGRRADIDAMRRRLVGIQAGDWPGVKLEEILYATIDVAADIVGIVGLHRRRPERAARQDSVAEAWCIALDLRLDPRSHIHIRAMRHVAVGPDRVLAGGSAAGI